MKSKKSNKKKIIIRSGSLRMGGLERVLIEALQTIDREKYEISLLITDDSGKDNIFLKDIPQDIKVYFLKPESLMRETEQYRLKRKDSLYNKFMYNYMMWKERGIILENTKKCLKEIGETEIFIDYDWGATKYIDKLDVKKSVVWIHNSIPSLLGNRKDKIERFGKRLNKYTKVVAICDEMKEEIERIYPYLKGKVERVYNPFNFERIERLAEDKSELTPEQQELMKERYCVAVSRLDNVQKDYPTLLRAFKILKDKGIEEKLFIIGDGPSRKEIENQIDELELNDQVKLIGLTKNPYVWMKNSDFFVHSSKYEGLPTVLIEAMICDKVVISSDCPTGPKEILSGGDCGILYPVGDEVQLAKDIEFFLLNKDIQEKYFEKLKIRRDEFNKNTVIREYERLIENTIE